MTQTTNAAMDLDWDAAEGADVAKESSKAGAKFDRVEYWKLDGSPAGMASGANVGILRFLSDHARLDGQSLTPWITVEQHAMVPTKPKPADLKENSGWPGKMGAVCRNGKIFKARYGDCYICGSMRKPDGKAYFASNRTWALAVVREEVIGDGSPELGGPEMRGKKIGIRDKMKEVAVLGADGKPTNETKLVKEYVKVNQGWKNFFSVLQGFAGYYGTVLDRDYYITRTGDDTNTTFQFVALDPIGIPDGNGGAKTFDLRDPEIRAAYYPDLPDLREFVAEQASDEHYNRFFVPGAPTSGAPAQAQAQPAMGGFLPQQGQPQGQAPQQAQPQQQQFAAPAAPDAPNSEPEPARLGALKDRIASYGTPQPPQAAQGQPGTPGGMAL